MNAVVQKIYWKAPYFVKNWMASMNAWKLDRQRHGRVFRQTFAEIAEHDKWSAEQFLEYQRQQLCSLIQHATKRVPYYRKVFSEAKIDPKSITEISDLQRLPILEKEVIRSNPESLLDETLETSKLLIAHTSGTTGTPVSLYHDVWLNSVAWAYSEARCHGRLGMRRGVNRSVSVGGHLVTAQGRTRPPFWVYNRRWRQLYMSSYHLSPKYLGYYVDELRRFKAEYIEGYPSSVYAIAEYIVDNVLEPVAFKACFTTAETLFDYQRETITKAFGCRICNEYGSAEIVAFAVECSDGSMHLSPEIGIVEVVDDNDRAVPAGQMGQLICTGLLNRVQPLIRYRIGDVGALKTGQCSCGSALPVLDSIQGRTGNIMVTRDGRQIGEAGLTLLFYSVKGIIEAQIIQDDYERFRVRVVRGKNYTDAEGERLVANLAKRLGQVEIRLELVDKIERTSAGKFMAVVSNLNKK